MSARVGWSGWHLRSWENWDEVKCDSMGFLQPHSSKLSAGTMILGCLFWRRSDQEIHSKTTMRSEVQLSCSNTLEVLVNPQAIFFMQLHRFLWPREPIFRLPLADIFQTVLENLQVQPRNRQRCWMSLKAWEILSNTTQIYERSYPPHKTAVLVCFCKICLIL